MKMLNLSYTLMNGYQEINATEKDNFTYEINKE